MHEVNSVLGPTSAFEGGLTASPLSWPGWGEIPCRRWLRARVAFLMSQLSRLRWPDNWWRALLSLLEQAYGERSLRPCLHGRRSLESAG